MDATVAILMSVFNGERYLGDQIDSLLHQSYTDWKLFIRDDGSYDQTRQIITTYSKKHPHKIVLLRDDAGNLKSAKSFMQLLKSITAKYYMFCDQDDVWLKDKIRRSVEKMLSIEKANRNIPALVFTDLSVVDEKLRTIAVSFWLYAGINPEKAKNFYTNACRSHVTGCTIIFNDELKKYAFPYPKQLQMHDWWLSLVASYYGIIDFIPDQLILYRQHATNVMGVNRVKKSLIHTFINNINQFFILHHFNYSFYKYVRSKIGYSLKNSVNDKA